MILKLPTYTDPHDPETPLSPAFVAVASYSLGGNPLVCSVMAGIYRSEAAARSGKARPIDVVQFRCGDELVKAVPAKVDGLGRVVVPEHPATPEVPAVTAVPAVVFPTADAIMAEARAAMVADHSLDFDAAIRQAIAEHLALHPAFAGAEAV